MGGQPQHHRCWYLWRRRACTQGNDAFVTNGGAQCVSGHHTRVEGVGTNPLLPQFHRQYARQPRHCRLARTIGVTPAALARCHRRIGFSSTGGDVDHHTAALLEHLADHRPGQQERCHHIALKDSLQGLGLQLHKRYIQIAALVDGIVDQYIHPAIFGKHSLAGGQYRLTVEQVHGHHQRLASQLTDCRCGGIQTAGQRRAIRVAQAVGMALTFVQAARTDGQIKTCTGKGQRGCTTNAATGAGNKCHFVHKSPLAVRNAVYAPLRPCRRRQTLRCRS